MLHSFHYVRSEYSIPRAVAPMLCSCVACCQLCNTSFVVVCGGQSKLQTKRDYFFNILSLRKCPHHTTRAALPYAALTEDVVSCAENRWAARPMETVAERATWVRNPLHLSYRQRWRLLPCDHVKGISECTNAISRRVGGRGTATVEWRVLCAESLSRR